MTYITHFSPFNRMVRAYGTLYMHHDQSTGTLVQPDGNVLNILVDDALDGSKHRPTGTSGTLVNIFGKYLQRKNIDAHDTIRIFHIEPALPAGRTQAVTVYAYPKHGGWTYSHRHDHLIEVLEHPHNVLIPLSRTPGKSDDTPWGWRFQYNDHRNHKWFYTRRRSVIERADIKRAQALYLVHDFITPADPV